MASHARITVQETRKIGKEVIYLLHLKKNKDGRYDTAWGDKTVLGLGATIERIVIEKDVNHINLDT